MVAVAKPVASGQLRRRLGLGLLVLYGIGITVGAGIYVLIGAVAGQAGVYAPWAFLLAALAMSFTVGSYMELATRFPVSAGEAAYVKAAFGRPLITRTVGLATLVTAIISSAAVALGSAGYIAEFVALPRPVLVVLVLLAVGAVAAYGILESVVLAGVFTIVEVGGLLAIIIAAMLSPAPLVIPSVPPADAAVLTGIATGSLIAFFAFIGFEELANIAEEAKEPERSLPLAMIITLVVSAALYVLIAIVAVSVVEPGRLAKSSAPLSDVFRAVAAVSPATITAIAIMATINTILASLTMASRVAYGMARQGDLPKVLGDVNAVTGTPLVATALTVGAALVLALAFNIEPLAEATSVATLIVFALVNMSLIVIRWRGDGGKSGYFRVPGWVPYAGVASSVAMALASVL
ncbi:MAG TPA: amino acid permease [Hyphomicrobiaceae bacterium]|nr:amino acid permease [Hyphomicrobiaceae bacterium]